MPATQESGVYVSSAQLDHFHQEGYFIARGLFHSEEAQSLLSHFMHMHAQRRIPNYTFLDYAEASGDPLKRYPRIMQPHRWDPTARKWLLDSRVLSILCRLLGEKPLATQSMLYFKPPGARGQAFHQDNFYLKVRPKSCVAAWTALDRADLENGGLMLCPRTHTLEVVCPEEANLDLSFTKELVRPPPGCDPEAVVLDPGDVLFFNGSVVHGSTPNTSSHRWRRSFICHYAPESMTEIGKYYFPILNMDGKEISRAIASGGGPCGTEAQEAH